MYLHRKMGNNFILNLPELAISCLDKDKIKAVHYNISIIYSLHLNLLEILNVS